MDNIKDVLNNVIYKLSLKQPEKQCKIDRIWQNIATQKEQQHTRLDKFSDEILLIIIDTPAWMYHMKMQKRNLLRRLQEEMPDIKDIRLKVGNIR